MREWRKFKAALQESLIVVQEQPKKDIREHVLQQLPSRTQEAVIKKFVERHMQRLSVGVNSPNRESKCGVAVDWEGNRVTFP